MVEPRIKSIALFKINNEINNVINSERPSQSWDHIQIVAFHNYYIFLFLGKKESAFSVFSCCQESWVCCWFQAKGLFIFLNRLKLCWYFITNKGALCIICRFLPLFVFCLNKYLLCLILSLNISCPFFCYAGAERKILH